MPIELVFTPDGQLATYQSLSCMAFINGYLSIMAQQTDIIRNQMASHLHELMEDGEIFGWLKLKLRKALVWHRVAPPESSDPT